MKILIVSDTSSYMRGGVPAETRLLIRGLAARGHAVALLANAPLTGAETARHFPMDVPISGAFSKNLATALASFQPDFIHVMQLSTKGLLQLRGLLTGRRWGVTVHSVSPYERKIAGFHGSEALHYAVRWLRYLANTQLWRLALTAGRVPHVIVHSRFVADIVRRYGYPVDQVQIVPLPLPAGRASPSGHTPSPPEAGRLQLVTVGGVTHTKGQHDLVKALPLVAQAFPGVRAQFIGEIRDRSYAAYLQSLAAELGVTDRIALTTQLDDAEKDAAIQEADVYVQPSHEEGFCLAYAEAAATVARLVGTDTGAIAAISQSDPGARVVPPRDPAALGRAIIEIARVATPVDHVQARLARMSDAFSNEAYIGAHERLYREAAG